MPKSLVLTHCGIGVDLSNPSEQRTFLTIQREADGASLIIDLSAEAMNKIIVFAEGGVGPVQAYAPEEQDGEDESEFPSDSNFQAL